MTRINIISPEELTDQHLVAEYREIFMVGSALQKSIKSAKWENIFEQRPQEFTLNKGHVKFFYDKGKYLYKRYLQIKNEMRARGMKPDPNRKFNTKQWPSHLFNDWEPKNEDLIIIRERIKKKIEEKPNWYKKTSLKFN